MFDFWRLRSAFAATAFTLVLAGCSKQDASSQATSAPDAVASVVVLATASASGLASEAPDAISSSAVTSASPAAGSPVSPSAALSAAPSFTDIAGVNGRDAIVGFAQLGVLDPTSGAFRPGDQVKRREFIRWLVKANNALWSDTPAKRINLADSTEKSAFPDVPTTDPDFPYVQGMQDAGYSVGFPDERFRPDDALTREQMFAIKNVFDRGTVDAGLAKGIDYARNTAMAGWKDKATISKTYVPGIATGDGGGQTSFSLVYGSSSLFRPQLAVTRAQAVVVMSVIGEHVFYGSGRRTLAQTLAAPAASPTP